MRYFLIIAFAGLLIFPSSIFSQEEKSEFGIKFNGFVKNDFYYDSRQTIDAREGHLLLYPANVRPDEDGKDINDQGSFHFLSIASRLSGQISAPDAFGAKTSGVIEAEFFGNTNQSINEFRLRHAFLRLQWEKAELLTGQFWHPMFVTESFPGTVSFNTGIGFQPFARSPQIRFNYNMGDIKLMLAAVGERDFGTIGFDPTPNNHLRYSKIPQLHTQIHYSIKNPDKQTEFIAGIGGAYKNVIPQIVTTANYKTEESLGSISAIAFLNLKLKPVRIKLQAVYGENMTDVLFFGGFAIKDTLNHERMDLSYTPIRNAAFWADISTTGTTWQFGVFAGYNQNLGTVDNTNSLNPVLVGRATNIAALYRLSPRIVWNSGRARIAAEVEYTVAQYGDGTYDSNGIPQNPNEVGNIRFLLGTYVFF